MSSPARISAPRGCDDVLPTAAPRWRAVERIAREVAARFHFSEIRTPEFEHTELFHRGVGEATDVVSKETYTFDDRSQRSLTLRPEGTAGVVRAMIEHGTLNEQGSTSKVFYLGSNFRYERPASGRLRIHHQFGAEAFGVAGPEQDVECVALQMDFYRACGLKGVALQVNSLGDAESKARYRAALLDYLSPKRALLSADSQRRLETNPLRILDSKDPQDRAVLEEVPSASASLSDKSRAHFERACALLAEMNVPFTTNFALVRGFDYYTETLWEVTAEGLGAQSAVGGGGRYDNLVETLGGRPTPAVGFGSGLERLLLALEAQGVALPDDAPPLAWVAYLGEPARRAALKLVAELRAAGLAADADLAVRNLKHQFKMAEKAGAAVTLTMGDDELAAGVVNVKTMATRAQEQVARGDALATVRALLSPSPSGRGPG